MFSEVKNKVKEQFCGITPRCTVEREVDAWLKGATEYPGSWWPDWQAWLAQHSGDMVAARKPGDSKLAVIEDAPGSFVKVRSA